MTKRCELSLNVARSNQRWHRPREAESAARVFAALIASERRLAHPGHVRETERREAVRPRVLIIVFSKHCVDQLQTGAKGKEMAPRQSTSRRSRDLPSPST